MNDPAIKDFLGKGREYVVDIADLLGYLLKNRNHKRATSSCKDKINLLRETEPCWNYNQAVKALYGGIDGQVYGFIVPDLKLRIVPSIISNIFTQLDLDPPFNSEIDKNVKYIPAGMEKGTCTPFVTEKEMSKIERIFVHDIPSLDDSIVDISIGGKGDEAKKKSLHLQYRAIFDILKVKYDNVSKVDFFKQ